MEIEEFSIFVKIPKKTKRRLYRNIISFLMAKIPFSTEENKCVQLPDRPRRHEHRWGLNSFDQWGVELGKRHAGDIEACLLQGHAQGMDASTAGLLARLR